ncbi:MAG: TIGR02147 family protein, partial [Chitinivibrionales bacterium]|nr:TIGR02147 family protein [Chitinivibrionales bacterium]MBD3357241.1 TIGR02147 family protein [Chitinivibrionales bacterium]
YFYKFKDDYGGLARRLDPPIRSDQAKKAIATLESLRLIERDNEGYCRQTARVITTGKGYVRTLQTANFQAATMNLARESLDRHSREDRDISTLTLTVSPESLAKIKMEIEALQNRILKIVETDETVDRVYQVNFQVFPLTKHEEDSQ